MIGYNKVNFENLPSENTPISAENLDIMDQGIFDLDNAIEVNPASVATTDLKSIRLDDTVYKIAGGHELVNSSGSTMTQRSKMAFLDTHLTDDSGNNTTKVQVTKEITTAQFLSETEEGLYFFTDMPDSVVTAEQVAYDSDNSVKDKIDNLIKTYTGNITFSNLGRARIDTIINSRKVLSAYVTNVTTDYAIIVTTWGEHTYLELLLANTMERVTSEPELNVTVVYI